MNKRVRMASILSLMASMGAMPSTEPPDRSQRESNRMPLNAEELMTLSTLTGKEKKKYVASLRDKYHSKTTIK